MQRDAVGDGGHAELAHAVVDVVTRRVNVQRFRAGPHGQVAWRQVSGAAEELRQHLAEGFQRVLRGLAAGDVGRVGLQLLDEGFGVGFPVGRQFAVHAAFELGSQFREGLGVGGELVVPGRFFRLAGFFGIPLGIDVLRDFEGGVFPAQGFAGGGHFGGAQRSTVHVVGTGLVRGAETNHGFAHQQGRLVSDLAGFFNRGLDGIRVVAVHVTHHVPAVGFKALGGVVGEPAFHVTVDGDAVVIVERGQFAELEGTGQGTDFVRDAFHHAAVAHKGVGVVVDHVMARAVELRGQGAFGNGEADGVGDALAQWAGGGFHAWGVAVFRVARGFGVQLAEVFQLAHRQVVAGEVQQAVNQHGAMAVREDEAVTVSPVRVGRVVVQVVTPQDFGDVRHAHRCTRVAGICFLYGVHAECADGVGKLFTRGHVLLQVGLKNQSSFLFSQTPH
ncbi:Uncharacterised protein [Serratia liquefaciens]|nr:Uncharacterised protein [Serratia liquefaciens]